MFYGNAWNGSGISADAVTLVNAFASVINSSPYLDALEIYGVGSARTSSAKPASSIRTRRTPSRKVSVLMSSALQSIPITRIGPQPTEHVLGNPSSGRCFRSVLTPDAGYHAEGRRN